MVAGMEPNALSHIERLPPVLGRCAWIKHLPSDSREDKAKLAPWRGKIWHWKRDPCASLFMSYYTSSSILHLHLHLRPLHLSHSGIWAWEWINQIQWHVRFARRRKGEGGGMRWREKLKRDRIWEVNTRTFWRREWGSDRDLACSSWNNPSLNDSDKGPCVGVFPVPAAVLSLLYN